MNENELQTDFWHKRVKISTPPKESTLPEEEVRGVV